MIIPSWIRIAVTLLLFLARGTVLIKILILLALSVIVGRLLRRISFVTSNTNRHTSVHTAETGKKVVDGTSVIIDDNADNK